MFSFSAAAKDDLGLPPVLDGMVWRHQHRTMMHRPHHHDELEVNLIVAGRASYLLDDQRYDLRRNTLVWLFPGQDHILLDESSDYEMWLGIFTPDLLRRVCTTTDTKILCVPNPPGHFCRRLSDTTASKLVTLWEELDGTQQSVDRYNAGLGYTALSAWMAYSEADDVPNGKDIHPAVERAARLIRDDPGSASVEEIAGCVGLSASRLSRLFAAQMGVSLVDFRNEQRLNRFLQLYGRGSRMTVLAAALEAGFGSYPQFHRVFTQRMGCGPAAFRRK